MGDLVVTTPERVSFSYTTAGLGTRFVAQAVDLFLLAIVAAAGGVVLFQLATVLPGSDLPLILLIFFAFSLLWGYFVALEAIWSGQTPGKRLLRLRVVGLRGEPITLSQAAVRNLLRPVDFLPVYYGVGIITIFASTRSQRLGDMAAGTVVVRERQAIGLRQLLALASDAERQEQARWATMRAAGISTPRRWAPQMEPALRRFIQAYAGRRAQLPPDRRRQLAAGVEPALRAAAPQLVASHGALSTLDLLADELEVS